MISTKRRKTRIAYVPSEYLRARYCGSIGGIIHEASGVINIFSEQMKRSGIPFSELGEIVDNADKITDLSAIRAFWNDNILHVEYDGADYEIKYYDLFQNIFSRNTGILESKIMSEKRAVILGCGSVGSLIALELARAGVGNFLLVDNDILEYHNLCRHQCSISDVGDYKVSALKRRIIEINPSANVDLEIAVAENVRKETFDRNCVLGDSIIIGCADNRQADVYGNSIAVLYNVPFISIGFWERAFAGEIFYYLPGKDMPCYKCALGDGSELSARASVNRRVYTMQEDLSQANFEPGISVDINFVTTIGIKLILDILNENTDDYTPRLLDSLQQYTLVCNTNKVSIGGEMAEIFSYPLQVTTSLKVGFSTHCPPCEFEV